VGISVLFLIMAITYIFFFVYYFDIMQISLENYIN